MARQGKPQEEGVAKLPTFLAAKNLKPFISEELAASLCNPIEFIPKQGRSVHGFRAELVPSVCDVWSRAKDAGVLQKKQLASGIAANILLRGLAHVGIIALVDEVTGYQDDRAKNALAKILEQFIAKELRPYVSAFPVEWFKELCRLRGIQFREDMRLPQYFGKLVNNLIYCRLAPGVLAELDRKNPVVKKGRRANKHYKWLTENVGHPKLLQLLGSEVTLMKLSKEWAEFTALVDGFHPVHKELPLFDWAERENL